MPCQHVVNYSFISHRNPFLHYQPIVSQKERTKVRTITVAATTVLGGLAVMTLIRIVRDWGSIPRWGAEYFFRIMSLIRPIVTLRSTKTRLLFTVGKIIHVLTNSIQLISSSTSMWQSRSFFFNWILSPDRSRSKTKMASDDHNEALMQLHDRFS